MTRRQVPTNPTSHPSATGSRRSITPPSTTSTKRKTQSHTIPAAHGFAFHLKANHTLRITDLHGSQVVDFNAWCYPYTPSTSCEHFSASYTRYNLGSSAPPAVGEHLYSNHDRPMLQIVADDVKVHDFQYMCCNPGLYRRLGNEGHKSCAENIAEAVSAYLAEHNDVFTKFEWYQVHDPFNIFQNTPYYALKGGINPSRKGDAIELKALMDVVVALSSCPYEEDGFNGGKVTEVEVTWEISD